IENLVQWQFLWQTAPTSMRRAEHWPGTILHVDLHAFYTSVHQADDASLRGRPVAVAGRSRRAVVVGASYEARAFGVHSTMPLHEALRRYPGLAVLSPDHGRYREASRQVHAIFRRVTSPEKIEAVALDEADVDVTAPTRPPTSSPEEAAPPVKYTIHTEGGLTASIGVATNKPANQIARNHRKTL